MTRHTSLWSQVGLPLILALASFPLTAAEPSGSQTLYVKQDSLQTTMLATRGRHAAWLAEQAPARRLVKAGVWQVTAPIQVQGPEEVVSAQQNLDPGAKDQAGKPQWTTRADWKDGTLVSLADVYNCPHSVCVCLCRELVADRAVTLSVGMGGGDHLDLWLNGRKLLGRPTALVYERYGTSMRAEGTRRDQLIVDLPLQAGRNRLLVKLHQGDVHPHQPYQFCFSLSPDPVPGYWQQILKDFPREEHRLLKTVPHGWFERDGWFAATTADPERQYLDALLAELGAAGDTVRLARAALLARQAPPQDPGWLDTCVTAAELASSLQDLRKLRAAVESLSASFPAQYPGPRFLHCLDDYRARLIAQASRRLDPGDASSARLLAQCRQLQHEMLVAENPLLKGRELLLVKRPTYDSQHYYDDYYHGIRQWGGNVCRLALSSGAVRALVPQLAGGVFDRYDLSFDARQILFGYRAPKPEGYRIWQVNLDGTGLRQLTFPPPDEADRVARHSDYPADLVQNDPRLYGHWTDDLHPCYLPDGRIALVSSRCERSVLCGGHALTTTVLFQMRADGSHLAPLSQGSLSEFTPTLLDDGRILYNRWEYVYKGVAAIQPLWAMWPDGGGSEEIYGNNVANPGVFVQARQVPGRPDLLVTTGCGHEPLAVGGIYLVDRHKDKRSLAAMTSLTPDTKTEGLRGLCQQRNGQWVRDDVYGPFYCDPYPLSEQFFLVACNPDRRYNDLSAYGIYLLDVFGNLVPVYRDPQISCWQPMVLGPRPVPPRLPPVAQAVARDDQEPEAVLMLGDVYQGLPGVPRGAVKYLRVMEQIPRSWEATRGGPDAISGQSPAISLHTHIWVAVHLGVVPVEADGSACFRVPAQRNLFFQALDADFMEVQKMRTFVNLRPGETRSCVGCHEHRNQAPASRPTLALRRPPSPLGPQPGEQVPRPIHYASDVQPILDRHCVRCHREDKADGGLDLSGALTTHFNRSYENLLTHGLVNFIQEWTGPGIKNPPPCYLSNGAMSHAEAVPPYTYGSQQSRLIALLRAGHEDAKLSQEEFVRLVTWVDANAPFYGSYFGKRHVQFAGHPDFRPVPTLASARGVAPEPYRPPTVPAELVARWLLNEKAAGPARDDSGQGHGATIVGARPVAEGPLGSALRLQGKEYVEAGGLGAFDTLSLALWVKADTLPNRWNPLLFRDDWGTSSLHLSLLADGGLNAALNFGEGLVLHRRGKTPVELGRWSHVALVLDVRPGGEIRFYAGGKPDQRFPLDNGAPLLLDHFRLGAWQKWQNMPQSNFHGALCDVRVYRGLLSDAQVAQLAAEAEKMPGPAPTSGN